MSDEPDRSRIAREIVLYAAIVVIVGAAFAALRAARDGSRVLTYDVRPAPAGAEQAGDGGQGWTGEER